MASYELPIEQQIREELRKEGIDNLDELVSRVSQHVTEKLSEEEAQVRAGEVLYCETETGFHLYICPAESPIRHL